MKKPTELSPKLVDRIVRWAKGEITWAEVEGITAKQAADFARTGCELAERGQPKKAAMVFEGLVAINPRDYAARAALGTVYQKLGQVEDALKAYDVAIAGDPKNVVALANRGELRLQKGDAAGLEDLKRAMQADPAAKSASAKRAMAVAQAVIAKAAKANGAAAR